MKKSLFIATLLFFAFSLGTLSVKAQEIAEPHVEEHQFEENFKEKYQGRKFDYEGKGLKSKKKDTTGKNSEYSKDKPSESDINEADGNSTSVVFDGIFGTLLWIIGIAAFIFLIYSLVTQGSGNLFGRSSDRKLTNGDEISAENIETADINSLIEMAEKNGDFRLATRYLYLAVLKKLTLNKLIVFEDEKTNSDYLFELQGHQIDSSFKRVSYLYNYIWYGEFPVDDHQYFKVKDNFGNLLTQIA